MKTKSLAESTREFQRGPMARRESEEVKAMLEGLQTAGYGKIKTEQKGQVTFTLKDTTARTFSEENVR